VCPTGWQIDSAGNCTEAGNETNPYSLYLPASDTASGSADTNPATPAATACASGQFQDSAGACWPDTFSGWLEASTLFAGYPNYEVAGGAAAAALVLFLLMRRKAGRK